MNISGPSKINKYNFDFFSEHLPLTKEELNLKEEYMNLKFENTGPRFKLIQDLLDKGCDHLMISNLIGEQQLLYILRRLQKDKQAFLQIKRLTLQGAKRTDTVKYVMYG